MKFFRKTDIIIIAIILIVSLVFYVVYSRAVADRPTRAEIYYYSELVETIELDKGIDKTFFIPQNPNVIFHLYADGSICFERSDCPDQVCVHTGRLEMIGEYAACLPNGIILKIVPAGERQDDDIDLVVGK
jgi:hypothetical protein